MKSSELSAAESVVKHRLWKLHSKPWPGTFTLEWAIGYTKNGILFATSLIIQLQVGKFGQVSDMYVVRAKFFSNNQFGEWCILCLHTQFQL